VINGAPAPQTVSAVSLAVIPPLVRAAGSPIDCYTPRPVPVGGRACPAGQRSGNRKSLHQGRGGYWGGNRNDPLAEVIGIFGVGGKRASIALGEQVAIKTRYKRQQSYQIDITKDWLENGDWEIPAYSIPNIEPGTTWVEISHLHKPFNQQDVEDIRTHLGETYAVVSRPRLGRTSGRRSPAYRIAAGQKDERLF
jgi:hypothetical protein